MSEKTGETETRLRWQGLSISRNFGHCAIKLIRFQLDVSPPCTRNADHAKLRKARIPQRDAVLIMRRCVGRIARDATEKLRDKSCRDFPSRTQAAAATAFMRCARERAPLINTGFRHAFAPCDQFAARGLIIKARYSALSFR